MNREGTRQNSNAPEFSQWRFWSSRATASASESIISFAVPAYLALNQANPLIISTYLATMFIAEAVAATAIAPLGRLVSKVNPIALIEFSRFFCASILTLAFLAPEWLPFFSIFYAAFIGILNGCNEILLLSALPKYYKIPSDLQRANAIFKTTESMTNSIGSFLASIILQAIGALSTIAIGAIGYLVSAINLRKANIRIDRSDLTNENTRTTRLLLQSGRININKHPELRMSVTIGCGVNFGGALTSGTMAVFIIQELAQTTTTFAAAGVALAFGTMLGGMLSSFFRQVSVKGLVHCISIYSIGALILAVPSFLDSTIISDRTLTVAILIGGQFIIGLACGLYISINSTFLQLLIPKPDRVATFAFIRTCNRIAIPAGMLVGGFIAETISAGISITISAILVTSLTIYGRIGVKMLANR